MTSKIIEKIFPDGTKLGAQIFDDGTLIFRIENKLTKSQVHIQQSFILESCERFVLMQLLNEIDEIYENGLWEE